MKNSARERPEDAISLAAKKHFLNAVFITIWTPPPSSSSLVQMEAAFCSSQTNILQYQTTSRDQGK
jgi:hypothetical protein